MTSSRRGAVNGTAVNGTASAGTLGSLGESEVLARIFPRLPDAQAALIGPGDDAAVLAAPDGRYVVTTDTMVHGPDFRLAWSTPAELGWKAAATNLSDIAAMGARPTALVIALVAPAGAKIGPWCVTKQKLNRARKGKVELLHAAPVQRVRVPSR